MIGVDMIAIYDDISSVSNKIKDIININRYGELHYKKQQLHCLFENIFNEAGISKVVHLEDYSDLEELINKIENESGKKKYVYMKSSMAVLNQQELINFLKKINFVDLPLAVNSKHGDPYPLLVCERVKIISILKKIKLNNDFNSLRDDLNDFEKFNNENYFIDISDYKNFIKFLHSNFELRYFNSIEESKYHIVKRSSNVQKIKKEYTYYGLLPEELKQFFVMPYDYKEESTSSEYKMKKLNIPDVAFQWVHDSFAEEEFYNLLDSLFYFLSNRKVKNIRKKKSDEMRNYLYIEKVNARISDFKQIDYLYPKIESMLKFRDLSLDEIVDEYKNLYSKINLKYKLSTYLAISHGDLCFSNILYDKKTDLVNFIDVKGALTEEELYMDPFYDLAKLSHSIMGNYDYINSGLFDLNFDNGLNISIDVQISQHTNILKNNFIKKLNKSEFSYELVRLYEASLFLSMLPLHSDSPKKVMAFILTATEIIEELKNNA